MRPPERVPGPAATLGAVTLIVGLSYWRTRDDGDPGITTEIALVLTVPVGALAMRDPAAAGAASVMVALLLAARKGFHHFVSSMLSEEEVHAALILAAAVVVVMPLLPDRPFGPFDALNPRSIWRLVVLVLAIGATGHIAVRVAGPRFLRAAPTPAFTAKFVSSSATIGAMGSRAAKSPKVLGAATAGAILSTVATVIQMAAVVGATSAPTLEAMTWSLVVAGVAAAGYGAVFTIRALRQAPERSEQSDRAFSLSSALIFAATLSAVLLGSAALREWFGEAGAIAAAGLAGFVDTHATAISIAALVAAGKMTPADAVFPILVGMSTNTVTKIVVASTAGGRSFAIRVIPGLILVIAAAWAGALAMRLARPCCGWGEVQTPAVASGRAARGGPQRRPGRPRGGALDRVHQARRNRRATVVRVVGHLCADPARHSERLVGTVELNLGKHQPARRAAIDVHLPGHAGVFHPVAHLVHQRLGAEPAQHVIGVGKRNGIFELLPADADPRALDCEAGAAGPAPHADAAERRPGEETLPHPSMRCDRGSPFIAEDQEPSLDLDGHRRRHFPVECPGDAALRRRRGRAPFQPR